MTAYSFNKHQEEETFELLQWWMSWMCMSLDVTEYRCYCLGYSLCYCRVRQGAHGIPLVYIIYHRVSLGIAGRWMFAWMSKPWFWM